MWISFQSEQTTELYVEDIMEEPIRPTDNGTANVPEQLGKELVDRYENIREYSSDG